MRHRHGLGYTLEACRSPEGVHDTGCALQEGRDRSPSVPSLWIGLWHGWNSLYPERGSLGKGVLQKRQGHVVDRHVALRPPLRPTMVRMAVEHGGYLVAVQRLLEPARSQKGEDLGLLTLDGGANG